MRIQGGLITLLLLGAALVVLVALVSDDAAGAMITVPDDYPTVQSAIDNADDYDTVFIKDGHYMEHVTVYRPLTIVGESRDRTVIEHYTDIVVLIVANKVDLSTMTVRGTTTTAGIILQASYCTIEDVTVMENLWGMWVNRGYHNTIRDVLCRNNSWQGVLVEESDHTLLENVTCRGNNEGIMVRAAYDTTVRECIMVGNRLHGFQGQRLWGSYETEMVELINCLISDNTLSGCEVDYLDGFTMEGCTVEDNGAHGIVVRYSNDTVVRSCRIINYTRFGIGYGGEWAGKGCVIENNIVSDEGASWSDIMVRNTEDCRIINNIVTCLGGALAIAAANDTLVSGNVLVSTNDDPSIIYPGISVSRGKQGQGLPSNNITIQSCEVRGFAQGMAIRGGKDVTILDCTVEDADVGILFEALGWGDVPLDGGLIKGCTFSGCGLDIQGMKGVTFEDNLISGADIGIFINATNYEMSGNVILGNTIRDCTEWGLFYSSPNGTNTYYLNSFMNNTEHSFTPDPGDVFDDGAYGNFWDDYEAKYPSAMVTGQVWDTPYAVGGSVVYDRYPLAYVHDVEIPVADAGEDVEVLAGTEAVLDASGSTDDHTIVNWTWTFTYEGSQVMLYGATVSFTFLRIGSYEATLSVLDAWDNGDTDTMTVLVYDDEDPEAVTGEDVTVGMGDWIYLDGSGSSDNGFIVGYEWSIDPANLNILLDDVAVNLTLSTPGDYTAILTVMDEAGNTAWDDLTIHVLDTQPPVADAGGDIETGQVEEVTLYGSASTDNVNIVSWVWSFETDDGFVALAGKVVTHTFDIPGVYSVELNVTDGAGNHHVDHITVTVLDTEPPVADAGEDIEVDQGTTVTFNATGSTDNVGVVTYRWSFVQEFTTIRLEGPTPSYMFDVAGTYTVYLSIFDEAAHWVMDVMIVTVREVETERLWELGPFRSDSGAIGGVRVWVNLNETPYVVYTHDDGMVEILVAVKDLVSPVSVIASKEGWKDLEFEMPLDENGNASGTIPVMKRAGDGGDDEDDDDDTDWLPWTLVVILIIAYAGTLLYLSQVAKENE